MGKRGTVFRYVIGKRGGGARRGLRRKQLALRARSALKECRCGTCLGIIKAKSVIEEICDKYEKVLRMLAESDRGERHENSES